MTGSDANKGAGKGSKPRNCFSREFWNRFDEIDWRDKRECPKCKKQTVVDEGDLYVCQNTFCTYAYPVNLN
jgi:hypothetical protein